MKSPGGKIKALLVDDERLNLVLVEQILQKLGLETVTAEDGFSGLEKVISESPDIVFTDLIMPRMSGIEFSRRIKSLAPRLPVILMSAFDGAEVESTTNGLLQKPVSEAAFRKTLISIFPEWEES